MAGNHYKALLSPWKIFRYDISSLGVVFLKGCIHFYRLILSPLIGPVCRFSPTCSAYSLEALQKYGVLRGTMLSLRRLLKCHPWHPGGIDHVPSVKFPHEA